MRRHSNFFKNKPFHCCSVKFFFSNIVKNFFHRNSRWFSVFSQLAFKSWLPKKIGGSREPLSIKHSSLVVNITGCSMIIFLSPQLDDPFIYLNGKCNSMIELFTSTEVLTQRLHAFLSLRRANVTQWSNYLPQRAKVLTQRSNLNLGQRTI